MGRGNYCIAECLMWWMQVMMTDVVFFPRYRWKSASSCIMSGRLDNKGLVASRARVLILEPLVHASLMLRMPTERIVGLIYRLPQSKRVFANRTMSNIIVELAIPLFFIYIIITNFHDLRPRSTATTAGWISVIHHVSINGFLAALWSVGLDLQDILELFVGFLLLLCRIKNPRWKWLSWWAHNSPKTSKRPALLQPITSYNHMKYISFCLT